MPRSAKGPVRSRLPAHAAGVLADNQRHYELLVELAAHYAARGDTERVLRTAMAAGNYAWLAPVGLLSDLRLERIVVHAVRGSERPNIDSHRDTGRVLHVLTEAYSVGGHSRLAWRWMSRDQRRSDVVLTNQQEPVPEQLVESVRASGGRLHDLRVTTHGALDRARALRAHMDRADLVVLHVHPYDSIALAATNLSGVRPPVIYENHADAAFWLGVSSADLLCDWRPEVRAIDVRLRGVPDERIAVLPMPVDSLPSTDGTAIRHRLGILPDTVVALTVSADWKMAASWGRGMHHVIDRVLHWSPQVSMVLVGATPNAEWARLATRYPGRVFPVGRVSDPSPYFDMADIYLDSYPTRAGTSVLEAALLGLPVVAMADDTEDELVRLHQGAAPGLAALPVAATADQVAVAVRRLATDAARRVEDGEKIRAAVRAVHDGPGWRAALESIYARARSVTAVDADLLGDSVTDERYGALLLSATAAPQSPDPRALLGPLGGLLDPPMARDLTAAVLRGGRTTCQVRVATGWQLAPQQATRLLGLAATYRWMTVSLPFVPDDDMQGTRTVAQLTELLARLGQTAEDCGDIRLETAPDGTVVPLIDDLLLTDDALDRLDALLASPLWNEPPAADACTRPEREALTV